ncbi:MAG: 6-phosphogluconolactonase [Aquabacterium sp.]
MVHFHHAASPSDLAVDLARFVAGRLRASLAQRGQALLVVSGGSTPVPFFEALSGESLDWPHVAVTLADERWLPADHADSNERLVRQHLLQSHAASARFVPLYNGAATPEQGQPPVEAALATLPWPADAVILGMGGDGHTASLFPQASGLLTMPAQADGEAGGVLCAPVPAPAAPNVPVPRLTLTPHALLQASQLIIHITGQAKLTLLRQAMQAGPVADLPIRLAVQQTRVPCAVFHSP